MNKLLKVIRVILNTLMTLILIIGTVFIVLYVIGIEPYVVETGSMKPAIESKSLSFINKNVDYESIKENDIIAFKTSTGDRVTHRVIRVTQDGLETKGDSNDRSDGISTNKRNYIGQNIFSIPKLGYFVKALQTTSGKIMLITIIIVILLAGFLTGDKRNAVNVVNISNSGNTNNTGNIVDTRKTSNTDNTGTTNKISKPVKKRGKRKVIRGKKFMI